MTVVLVMNLNEQLDADGSLQQVQMAGLAWMEALEEG